MHHKIHRAAIQQFENISTNQHSLTEVIACKEICRPALEEIVQAMENVLILQSWLKTECGM